MKYEGVMKKMRSSSPSLQYETPRPDVLRGAEAPRAPSSNRYHHSVSPVAGSIATAERLEPAVVYKTPFIMIGVARKL